MRRFDCVERVAAHEPWQEFGERGGRIEELTPGDAAVDREVIRRAEAAPYER